MDFGDDVEEARHFGDVVLSLSEYVADAGSEIHRRENALRTLLPLEVSRFAANEEVNQRMMKLRECAKANQEFFDFVTLPYEDNVRVRAKELQQVAGANVAGFVLSGPAHMSKARSTLHQIVREWSDEGRAEREKCFEPILREMTKYCPKGSRVAVPGCGLGRLVVEIASHGYVAQGSEFSYQMLLTGDAIMNRLLKKSERTIYPWIDQNSNVRSFQSQTRAVQFPDVPCVELLSGSDGLRENLSICAGDFEEIYSREENLLYWDAVVFSFFLDTASNVISYLKVVHDMLRPGGVFISFGPLLWHFQPEHGGPKRTETDARFFRSLEVSLEDIRRGLSSFNFTIVHEETVKDCSYASNKESMMRTVFDCQLIVAIKSSY